MRAEIFRTSCGETSAMLSSGADPYQLPAGLPDV